MAESQPAPGTFHLAVRWTARISSLLVIGVFLLMFIGEGFDPAKVKPNEWIMLLASPVALILGMLIGWWKEGLGGAIIVLGYIFALRVGGYNLSGALYLLVCAAPGFLFLLSWILSKPVLKLPAWMLKELPLSEGKPPDEKP